MKDLGALQVGALPCPALKCELWVNVPAHNVMVFMGVHVSAHTDDMLIILE